MDKKITVVGIGPGSEQFLTLGALRKLQEAKMLVLRTKRHGIVPFLKEQNIVFHSLDFLYEESEDFDELNTKIAYYLIAQILDDQDLDELVYAVPGNGVLGDRSVQRLLEIGKQEGIPVEIHAGVSMVDWATAAIGEDLGANLRVLPAIEWESFVPDPRVPLLVIELDTKVKASELKLKLMEHYPAEYPVKVAQVSEDGEIRVCTKPLFELDRMDRYDHTLTLFLPAATLDKLERYDIRHLIEIINILRSPGGCPWDREQTHKSLKQCLIEEAYEVLEAIDMEDPDKLMEELGDVLLQVVFHARIAQEKGEFHMGDVATGVCRKMIERHTHIFGDAKVDTAQEVVNNWEAIKKKEKGFQSHTQVLKDIPSNLPALMRSYKLQQKAALIGFDWDNVADAMKKVEEELDEVKRVYTGQDSAKITEEIGDLLFAVVNVARFLKVQPELALTATSEKFIKRFQYIEETAKARGKKLEDMNLEEMDSLWNEAKLLENP